MRVISAYLLAREATVVSMVSSVLLLQAVLGGNANPTADDINKILSSVGIEADSANVDKLLSEMEGKNILEVMAAGREKLASVPSGGAVVASGGAAPAAAAGGADEAPAAAPAKEESEEEEDMGFSLFD